MQAKRGTGPRLEGSTSPPWSSASPPTSIRGLPYKSNLDFHSYSSELDGQELREPWCYTNQDNGYRETCGIAKCSNFNVYLYVAVPGIVSLALCGLCIGLCCMRKNNSRKSPSKKDSISLKLSTANLNVSAHNTLNPNKQQVRQNPLFCFTCNMSKSSVLWSFLFFSLGIFLQLSLLAQNRENLLT